MCLLLNWLEGVDPSRLLKKSIRSLFDSDHPWSSPYGRYQVAPTLSRRNCQHAKQKARFLLCFIFPTFSVFEKWRYVPIPHRRLMKNEFFINLRCLTFITPCGYRG